MFSYFARCFASNFILTRTSIYEKNPDIPPLVNNSMFEIKPTNSNRHSRRSAVLGLKQGMTAMWDKWGVRHALTVIQIDRCHVVQVKNFQNNYYLQLGVSERNIDKISKPLIGHYMKANLPPKKKLMECKVSPECVLPVGYELKAQHFVIGQLVDVKGTSKGKGFQGGIKRWNFNRQPASHGNSVTTRAIGSIGQRQDPGRTFPGKKMPGQLGNEYATIRKLKVYKIDAKRNLLFVKGGVPGGWGSVVRVCDSTSDRGKFHRTLPHPTYLFDKNRPEVEVMEAPEKDTIEENYLHDNAFPDIKDDEPIE